ncbi:purple acid phosphatase family protein [Alkalitalea saponilacus]|uniref:Purple acid Phosphatase, N-terminal domain n=1 Tax=Alkalitalea saponilacus TaxID=889453 RepID=A0A1T5ATP6_9BACT|nr:metallophosphoesterase family protein [Alkalitalea saponilacus]ASB48598.1 hypothetical protein CDL62_05310 [Alkalitalea saponilacus]SKB38306.1 Purple acid Phosphatase, N-terminal domain [Alkalitalea saponilacus]
MKIIKLLSIYFVVIAALVSCSLSAPKETPQQRQYPESLFPDRIMQNVTEDPATQIAVSWRTKAHIATGYVEYVKAFSETNLPKETSTLQANVKPVNFENIEAHYHQVLIENLEPATSYMIRVGNEEYRSEWFTVQTAPEQFEPFKFLWFGDVQNDIREFAPRIFRQATKMAPDAKILVHSGDLVLSSGDDDTWGEWFYAGGWLFQHIPSLAIAGNSDHFRLQEKPVDQRMLFPQWHGVFNFPSNGAKGLDNVTFFYDYPGVRFIGLYTNFESTTKDEREIYIKQDVILTDDLFAEQTKWLEETLKTNNQPWLIVVMHHPVFTAREDRDNELLQEHWLPLFEKYGVDLVLQGHDHVYARGINPESQGGGLFPVYVTSFAGGKSRPVDFSNGWITLAHEHQSMFQVVEVEESKINFEAFDALGNLMDAFVIEKSDIGKILID